MKARKLTQREKLNRKFNTILANRLKRQIKESLEQIYCIHFFVPYGHSYHCAICYYYCGDHEQLASIARALEKLND